MQVLHGEMQQFFLLELTRERNTKRLKNTRNLFRENMQLIGVCNSRLKAIEILGQRKAFFRQRIPESSCTRKQSVDIGIITSGNGDRKIMHSIRITSRLPSRGRSS